MSGNGAVATITSLALIAFVIACDSSYPPRAPDYLPGRYESTRVYGDWLELSADGHFRRRRVLPTGVLLDSGRWYWRNIDSIRTAGGSTCAVWPLVLQPGDAPARLGGSGCDLEELEPRRASDGTVGLRTDVDDGPTFLKTR